MQGCSDTAALRWEDGDLPVSTTFDDPYYARSDGLAESRHVFLDGNHLASRFSGAEAFHIAELGFGTGLNLLAALSLWRDTAPRGSVLTFTTFERFPMEPTDRHRALARWPELRALADDVFHRPSLPDLELEIIEGDARTALPMWHGSADAWFLDGFAPARNPEMWEPTLLAEVFRCTAPGGTFATYSAAGAVRRGLQEAGFTVERVPGYGHKREMLRGAAGAET